MARNIFNNNDTEIPEWLSQAVTRFFDRHALSVLVKDFDDFTSQAKVILSEQIAEPRDLGQTLVDTDSKVFVNTGSKEDTFTIRTQKTSTTETKKSYQLKTGKNTTYGLGGGLNVGANFFNIGGLGASLAGNYSKSKSKEETNTEENVRGLSQEYGIEGEIKVPAKKKVTVEIKTYAVSYESDVHLIVTMPTAARLRIRVRSGGCCGGGVQFVWLTADHFLTLFDEQNVPKKKKSERIKPVGPLSTLPYVSQLQYLGERTVIHKVKEENI